jgi:hypothetical protein
MGWEHDAAKVKKKSVSRDALGFDNPFALLYRQTFRVITDRIL